MGAGPPHNQDSQVIYSLQNVLGYLYVPWSCYCSLAVAKEVGGGVVVIIGVIFLLELEFSPCSYTKWRFF